MKTTFYTLIILLSLSITNQATADDKPLTGQAKLDSLLSELPKAKGDTNQVNLLNNLSLGYSSINPDKGIEYGEKGLALTNKIGWKKGAATSYYNLGINYYYKSDYPNALEYWQKALKINEELGNKKTVAAILGNIGLIYNNQSNYPKALEYYNKALKINEELGNKLGIATNLGNIGLTYMDQSDTPKALEYYIKALKIDEELGNRNGVARHLGNIGLIYMYQSNFPKALKYYFKALKIDEELGNRNGVARHLGNIGLTYMYQSNYPKAIAFHGKALKLDEELGNKDDVARHLGNMGQLYFTLSQDSVNINPDELNEYVSLNKDINLNRSIEYSLEAIKIYEEIGELNLRSFFTNILAHAYNLKGDYKKALEATNEYHKLKDSVFSEEKNKQLAAIEKAREDDVNRIKIEKQEVQLEAQESEKMFIVYSGIGIVAFVVAILILIAYQRKKSDKLLYNVLPISIAKRLKKKEHPISDHFAQASIIFIDIVGFTAMSKDSDPTDIVLALNKVFTHYDYIASKHGLEKIKTIGDCYMAAAGIPVVQKDNTLRAARMAIEVRDYMVDYYTDHGFKLDVRIGLDCGPVVAGVIGEKKFIYDMWSDAVNTASRMESSGQPGSVHVSERFKEALVEFDVFEFVERGEMEIKGKGKMKTFFIEERKKEVV